MIGDVVTDAMRNDLQTTIVDFAITNSGGLRADLTCPNPDLALAASSVRRSRRPQSVGG